MQFKHLSLHQAVELFTRRFEPLLCCVWWPIAYWVWIYSRLQEGSYPIEVVQLYTVMALVPTYTSTETAWCVSGRPNQWRFVVGFERRSLSVYVT
jgi:uncharacterized membrane protein (DUF106 family)